MQNFDPLSLKYNALRTCAQKLATFQVDQLLGTLHEQGFNKKRTLSTPDLLAHPDG